MASQFLKNLRIRRDNVSEQLRILEERDALNQPNMLETGGGASIDATGKIASLYDELDNLTRMIDEQERREEGQAFEIDSRGTAF